MAICLLCFTVRSCNAHCFRLKNKTLALTRYCGDNAKVKTWHIFPTIPRSAPGVGAVVTVDWCISIWYILIIHVFILHFQNSSEAAYLGVSLEGDLGTSLVDLRDAEENELGLSMDLYQSEVDIQMALPKDDLGMSLEGDIGMIGSSLIEVKNSINDTEENTSLGQSILDFEEDMDICFTDAEMLETSTPKKIYPLDLESVQPVIKPSSVDKFLLGKL